MLILIINSGSSSIKYQVMDMLRETTVSQGVIERIGGSSRIIHKTVDSKTIHKDLCLTDHHEACEQLLALVNEAGEISAIGHRIVHGGVSGTSPEIITDEVLEMIESASEFAPLHNPANIIGIRACRKAFGDQIPQVAVFDTAFHKDLPPRTYLYPIPYRYYTDYGIRRFGFHGISHRYASQRCAELMGRENIRVISCHLGNGCSLAAVENGICIDTSMGMTPNEGLMMGTRSGSIDPAIISYIAKREGISYEEILEICNRKAGLLGVSGISNDYRDLVKSDDPQAKLALEIQQYQIVKMVGAYLTAMNGADAIVFTGGIGENAPELRQYICDHLRFAGAALDEIINCQGKGERKISTPSSKISVYVIPANEELAIAKETYTYLRG